MEEEFSKKVSKKFNENRKTILKGYYKRYGRILTERLMQITEKKVSDEQGGFRRGKSCVDQMFAIEMLAEEYLGKGKKLYAAFMDREALWNVLRIYGVGGQLMKGIKAFYRGGMHV